MRIGKRVRQRPAADLTFDYKDPELLKPFLTDRGKIIPARVSRLNRKQQRSLATAIKRARQLAFLPLAGQHVNPWEY